MSEKANVARAAGVVGAATLASRVMGYARDMVMSWAFGTAFVADAFYVAYRIPNLLRELLAEGSTSAAFIPVFSETLSKGSKEEARRLADALLARLLVIFGLVTLMGIIFAPFLVKAIAWGFRVDPEKYALTVRLTRLMFPYLFFIGLAALAMGMLNSLRSFLAPASSPVMYNMVIIFAVLLSVNFIENPIEGVAVGVVLGGLSQFLIQIPWLRRHGMVPWPRYFQSHPGVARIWRLALPVFLSSAVTQVNIFISTILASFLATGSIAYLYYGMRFVHLPLGVFGVAMATAILPTLSSQAARGELSDFRETFSHGLRLVLFIMFPAMVGLMTLRVPIVNLLLEHGEFDRLSTIGTASAILFYAVGLWAFAGVRITSQAFYSLHDTKTPVKVAAFSVVINLFLSIMLMGPLAHAGLALANSIAAMFNLGVLTIMLRRKIGRIDGRRIARALSKIIPASALIGLIGWWVGLDPVWDSRGMLAYKAGLLTAAVATSAALYFFIMWLLRSEELAFLIGLLKSRRKSG